MAKTCALTLMLLPLAALSVWSCSAAQLGPAPGEEIDCNGVKRIALDCSSEVDYQGSKTTAGINIADIAGIEGSYEETALRRVSEQIQQFVAVQTRACRDYNACILDSEQYRVEATQIRKKLTVLPILMEAVKSAKTDAERSKALDQLYRTIVPQEERVEELTFSLGMHAWIPEELGGGSFVLAPGGLVPTDARIVFTVDVSRNAHLYMFQTKPSGEITVLFPEPRIGTRNPLSSGMPVRIPPPGKKFRVNEKDVGTENVYFVVSPKPLSNLDAALNKVKSGAVSSISESAILQTVTTIAPQADLPAGCNTRSLELVEDGPGGGAPQCVRSRGLELDEGPAGADTGAAASSGQPSMMVRTAPGDDMIVKVFHFEHATKEAYRTAGGPGKVRTRGVVMED